MYKIKIIKMISFIFILVSATTSAQTFDRDYLTNFIKLFIEKEIPTPTNGQISIEVSSIDPRITIKPCQSQLQANIPEKHNGRNFNVKLNCNDETPWHIFFPVRIITIVPVVVAQNSISKGTRLDETNIRTEYKDISSIRGAIIDEETLVLGTHAIRTISAGTAITERNICFICKKQQMTIIAQSDNFMIKTTGIALENGAIGDQIRVKNVKSGRIIRARVKSINEVIINL